MWYVTQHFHSLQQGVLLGTEAYATDRGEESKQDLYCRDKSRSILLGEYLDGNLLIDRKSVV